MGHEIERKFLVNFSKLPHLENGSVIQQGYFPTAGNTVVRVRTKNNLGFLTIKGENKGIVRTEFEYPIPIEDACHMLENFCQKPFIKKTRYLILHTGLTWELDIFEEENQGLIIAEIELKSTDQIIEIPDWAIKEVTGTPKYYNSNLIHTPFSMW